MSSTCSKLSRPWLRDLVIALPLDDFQADGKDSRNDEGRRRSVGQFAT
jgi:hypothetical protein